MFDNNDVDYVINMVRLNERNLEKSHTLNQMISKALHTINKQCKELSLDKIGDKIYFHYTSVNNLMIYTDNIERYQDFDEVTSQM